jgi:hypothetical protein
MRKAEKVKAKRNEERATKRQAPCRIDCASLRPNQRQLCCFGLIDAGNNQKLNARDTNNSEAIPKGLPSKNIFYSNV